MKLISSVILLPSDVGKGELSLRVATGGIGIELCVRCASGIVDLTVLFRKWTNPNESG